MAMMINPDDQILHNQLLRILSQQNQVGSLVPGNSFNSNNDIIMAKYKNGDKVEFIKDMQISGNHRSKEGTPIVGKIYTISQVGSSTLNYQLNKNEQWYRLNEMVSKDSSSYVCESEIKGEEKKKKIPASLSHLDKLILAPEVKEEIVAVLKQHEHSKKIFDEWGLGETIEYGKGMTFMFWGGPGTGKTFAANCIAKALGKELLVIGAAEIQTSEPGGANRAIQEAFANAKRNKILFIDECDSLIFNRQNLGMVLGSEVNTLLTEIEKSESVVILATNRIADMDPALERRMSLIVEFPHPTRSQRLDIWKNILPKKMPLAKNVDLEELAKHKLTGGLIKNVVLQAARLAVSKDQNEVTKANFDQAINRVLSSQSLMGVDRINSQREGPEQGIGKSDKSQTITKMDDKVPGLSVFAKSSD